MATVPLTNPGFERGNIGWVFEQPSSWAIESDVANAASGSWRMRVTDVSNGSVHAISNHFAVRPGGKISARVAIKSGPSGSTLGVGVVRVNFYDRNGVFLAATQGTSVGNFNVYIESIVNNVPIPALARTSTIGCVVTAINGTWYFDNVSAFGDYIEDLPSGIEIVQSRMVGFDTTAVFEPLVGDRKFSTFNGGMSDRWSGVLTFRPLRGSDLLRMRAWLRRIGHTNLFFAYDPDHRTPVNGINPNLQVWGAGQTGQRLLVLGGSPNQTVLVEGDYFEIDRQYFQVQRDFIVGPDGAGFLEFWPALRVSPQNGEYINVDKPKMVARITSDISWLTDNIKVCRDLTIAFEEKT